MIPHEQHEQVLKPYYCDTQSRAIPQDVGSFQAVGDQIYLWLIHLQDLTRPNTPRIDEFGKLFGHHLIQRTTE